MSQRSSRRERTHDVKHLRSIRRARTHTVEYQRSIKRVGTSTIKHQQEGILMRKISRVMVLLQDFSINDE
jgi:hypothetical protein